MTVPWSVFNTVVPLTYPPAIEFNMMVPPTVCANIFDLAAPLTYTTNSLNMDDPANIFNMDTQTVPASSAAALNLPPLHRCPRN